MSKIVVTVKALIPVIQYGNIAIEATQEIEVERDDLYHETLNSTKVLRLTLADSILPLVESEVERCASVLLKEANPDTWMRRNSTVYQWFKISNPDIPVPAMDKLMKGKSLNA